MSFQGFPSCRFIHPDYYSHLGSYGWKDHSPQFFLCLDSGISHWNLWGFKSNSILFPGTDCSSTTRRTSTAQLILLRQTCALSSPAVEKTDKKDRKDGRYHLCSLGIFTFLHGSHLDCLDHTFGVKRKQTTALFVCAQGQGLFLRGQEKSLFLDLKNPSLWCS